MAPPISHYLRRDTAELLRSAAFQFPAITLTGPRQAGKTTLLRQFFEREYRYISVDRPEVRQTILADPRGFFRSYPPPVIFDEVQTAPELMPYVREHVDQHRSEPAQFILSGSNNILLSKRVAETLAGRTAVLRLFPFTQRELDGEPGRLLPWDRAEPGMPVEAQPLDWARLLRGFYPQVARDEQQDPSLWFASYLSTFAERDVRTFREVSDLSQFQMFMQALALRSGQLLNYSDVARDLGVAVNTVKAWLYVLEACYLVVILRPWFRNKGKRLVKTPKVYFLDVGLMLHLCGVDQVTALRLGPMAGPAMETLVISEVFKTMSHRGLTPRMTFWRTSTGREVDLVIETRGRIIPVEIKASGTSWPKMAENIAVFRGDYPEAEKGWVIYSGNEVLPAGVHATAWPATAL
ncbi:MAG TPA: ATP-binding protein [Paludibaculum sp.]|jgi:hypothetical protein